ncbi:MAG TPA: hypothetical protein VN931_02825 [Fibrobacteria bacterium]|nr:hypothetical protein [Fibrobacteria bacterium]
MTGTRRVALNAMATYGRSVVTGALALFSSRWVLQSLGQTDYGLYSLVGSVILFVTFLNGILASSVVRHLSFAMGLGDPREVGTWFNVSFVLHLSLAILLVVGGWPCGSWMVRHVLTIPPDRVESCLFVFHISLLSAFVSMASVPFTAMFTARQRIAELAAWGLLLAFLGFAIAWILRRVGVDRLRFYASGMVASLVLFQAIQVGRALWLFPECALRKIRRSDIPYLRKLGSFASWNLFGGSGILVRDQGSAILLNMFFGPAVNAAYGIANQVSGQTNQLSSAMVGAVTPEITATEGRGDRDRMLQLANRVSKFGTLTSLLFALPLLVEMEAVLRIWLVHPPAHAAMFCRFILATFLIDRLTTGTMLAVNAKGKIAGYQAVIGTLQFLNLPLGWVFLRMGYPPTVVGGCFMATMLASTLTRTIWMRILFRVPLRNWVSSVVAPVSMVVVSGLVGSLAVLGFGPSRLGTVVGCAGCVAGVAVGTWLFGLTPPERQFLSKSLRGWSMKASPA